MSSFVCSSAQTGTIHVAKKRDSLYIRVSERWEISRAGSNPDLTFTPDKNVYAKTAVWSPENSVKRIIKAPSPDPAKDTFDLKSFLLADPLVKSIRLADRESDILTYTVIVDKRGKMKFRDWQPVEHLGDTVVVYRDGMKQSYKIDETHDKTASALEVLSEKKWKPASISLLKKHPSRRRIKYRKYRGYAVGVITIEYSINPI
ncbi:MAG: hypothetical protein ACJ77K_08690 [Bacteroidia bacterium]